MRNFLPPVIVFLAAALLADAGVAVEVDCVARICAKRLQLGSEQKGSA